MNTIPINVSDNTSGKQFTSSSDQNWQQQQQNQQQLPNTNFDSSSSTTTTAAAAPSSQRKSGGFNDQISTPALQQQGSQLPQQQDLSGAQNQNQGDYSSLIQKLKYHIYGNETDYTNDPNFTTPLNMPTNIKTSITEVPEQLLRMLDEREPTFSRDLPESYNQSQFKEQLPERQIIRHRVVHPVQVQTIIHNVAHPVRRIQVEHVVPHEVVHEVVHEIPQEVRHVVQHQVPVEVSHNIKHQVNENVKHIMRHGVHQMVNHEISENVSHSVTHAINKLTSRGTESEINEDNKIPHSVTRNAPFVQQGNIKHSFGSDFQDQNQNQNQQLQAAAPSSQLDQTGAPLSQAPAFQSSQGSQDNTSINPDFGGPKTTIREVDQKIPVEPAQGGATFNSNLLREV